MSFLNKLSFYSLEKGFWQEVNHADAGSSSSIFSFLSSTPLKLSEDESFEESMLSFFKKMHQKKNKTLLNKMKN
jgi:hypothetical protein